MPTPRTVTEPLNQLTIEQWSSIEKSPFSVTSPSFIQYES